MSYQSKPTTNGVYRIKLLNQNRVIESVPVYNASLKLAPPNPLNKKQLVSVSFEVFLLERTLKMTIYQWNLTQVSGQSNVWTMISVEDKSGIVCIKDQDRYWNHGYPYPQTGASHQWSIIERTSEGETFSKLVKISNGTSQFAK